MAENPSEVIEVSYTCLLIPSSPSHQLTGDIEDYLPNILKKICNSYGWRSEFITVNPDYFQWVLIVPHSTSPNLFMQKIRSETSEFIFSNFANLRGKASSSDFWAPGYLVTLGTQPYSKEIITQIDFARRQYAAGMAGDSTTDAPLPDKGKRKKK